MYNFTIKDKGADINAVVTRSLLALAGIASLLYHGHEYYWVNIIAAVLLFGAAIFVNRLLLQYNISVIVLLGLAAIIVLAATLFIPFAVLLVGYGLASKKICREPVVTISTAGVHITKAFGAVQHSFKEFNNIILKDNLLTLDFVNNHLLQLTVNQATPAVDEVAFNTFCARFIGV